MGEDTAAPVEVLSNDWFCYVDGFHGGIDGHMPLGTLRDILTGLNRNPDWKVTFEIEPYSWDVVAKNDPVSISRLRKLLADRTPAHRVELVSGAYAQSYMWNICGESVIRHLQYGLQAIHATLPEAVVDTYAVQEPCWTSCLPQLLKSFGYRRAALTNSTCWGGYHAGKVNADLCDWTGPDGTSITAAPRYGIDQQLGPATEENADLPEGYIARCRAARIAHPVGTILQDAGWPGKPWVPGHDGGRKSPRHPLQHVTWRQYIDTIAEPATEKWVSSQEDMRVGLVWGGTIVQRIAQVCRAGENEIVQAEKLAAMAALRSGQKFPAEFIESLWTDLLLSQHHDVWIVPYNHSNVGSWASECDARYAHGHKGCLAINRQAMQAMASTAEVSSDAVAEVQYARVFNTAGSARSDVAAVDVVADRGTTAFRVRDSAGAAVQCQTISRRKFNDGTVAAATVLFPVNVAGMGYSTYRIESATGVVASELLQPATRSSAGATVDQRSDNTVVLETDQYKLILDTKRGGTVRSLWDKTLRREFVDRNSPRTFNEYRGYFHDSDGSNGQWLSSADSPAVVQVIETGPVRIAVRIKGHLGPHPFTADLSLTQEQRRIDCTVVFDFPVDGLPFDRTSRPQRVRIGEPWPVSRDCTRTNRRPFYDSSFKLQALFPAALGSQCTLHKNAPFDVCKSELADTHFDSWDSIKHNVILNWIDVLAEDGSAGLAIFCDHTTAYSHGVSGEPTGLVLGYSGLGNWFDYALGRPIHVSYALVPHANDWAAARLWRELSTWSEPLTSQIVPKPTKGDEQWSMLDATSSGLCVTSLQRQGEATLVRLFNADGDGSPQSVIVPTAMSRAELVELDGSASKSLPIKTASGQRLVSIAMPRLGVRTLRLS